jgi:hypothetical protein
MIHGTPIGPSGLTQSPSSSCSLCLGPTFSLRHEFHLCGKWLTSQLSRSLLQLGILQISECLVCSRLHRRVLKTVHQLLVGIYGPSRQHLCRRSHPFSTSRISVATTLLPFLFTLPFPGTHGNVSATFTSERHAKVNFENLSCSQMAD